jgi:hypothetical protein
MALTNAEHQALWRKRRAAELERLRVAAESAPGGDTDFDLYVRAQEPIIAELRAIARVHVANFVQSASATAAEYLERLNVYWPTASTEARQALAACKTIEDCRKLLQPSEALRKAMDDYLDHKDRLRKNKIPIEGVARRKMPVLRKSSPTAETLEKMRLGRERAKAQRKAWEEEKRIDAQEAAKRKRKAEALVGKTVANGCTPAEEAAAKAKLAEVLATPTKLEAARKASMDAMGAILRQGRKPLRNNRP